MEVKDDSESSSKIGAEVVGLASEGVHIARWEAVHGLTKGGELADKDEHLFAHVLGQLGTDMYRLSQLRAWYIAGTGYTVWQWAADEARLGASPL